jgi:hypothetical protein
MTYDQFIDRLSVDELDRAALREVARQLEGNPFMASSRLEGFLHQLAQPAVRPDGTELNGEESLEFMTSFAEACGVPADVVMPSLHAIGDVDFDSISTEQIEDQAALAHIDAARRADPDAYARSEYAQQEERAALERLTASRPGPAYTAEERARGDARIAEIEQKYMRAEPGSQDWRQYWRGPLQAEYAALLERKMAPQPMPEPEPVEPSVGE